MGLLDGGLQQAFGAAFGRLLLDGRHYKSVEDRDDKGNVNGTITRAQGIKGCRQTMNQAMREAGYASDSALLLVLQTYEGRALANPIERGDRVSLDGKWVVGDIGEDAAHAAYLLACTKDDG